MSKWALHATSANRVMQYAARWAAVYRPALPGEPENEHEDEATYFKWAKVMTEAARLADRTQRSNTASIQQVNAVALQRVSILANLRAYLSPFGCFVPTRSTDLVSGLYSIEAIHINVKGVCTNTVAVCAYRGAGRPEAAIGSNASSMPRPPPSRRAAVCSKRPTRRGLNPAVTLSRFRGALGSSRGLNRAAWGCVYFREYEVVHTSLLIPTSRVRHSEFGRCHEG